MPLPTPTLKAYRWLIRQLPGTHLTNRMCGLALLLLGLPVLALPALAVVWRWPVSTALTVSALWLVATAMALRWAFRQYAAPLQMTLAALYGYNRERVVTPIPTDLDGEVGELMRQTRKLMETNRDLAHSIQELSACDPISGLPGRRSADEYLGLALGLAERAEQKFCLALLELRQYPVLRERHGHDATKRALALAGDFLRLRLKRLGDWAGRWNEQTFIAVLIMDPQTAVSYLEDAAAEFARQTRGFEGIGLNLDIGLTDLRPGDNIAASLARAQAGVISASQEARGRVVAQMPGSLGSRQDDDSMLGAAMRARAIIP